MHKRRSAIPARTMGGENQEFDDIDTIDFHNLKEISFVEFRQKEDRRCRPACLLSYVTKDGRII